MKQKTISDNNFLILGPFRGITNDKKMQATCINFSETLLKSFKSKFNQAQKILIHHSVTNQDDDFNHKAEFTISFDFLKNEDFYHCVLTLRQPKSGQKIISVRRFLIPCILDHEEEFNQKISSLVEEIKQDMWKYLTFQNHLQRIASDQPLFLQLDDAAKLLIPTNDKHFEAREYLQKTLNDKPNNDQTKILLASNYYISCFISAENFEQNCDKIEELVISAMPNIQDDPIYHLTAAKMLHFIKRGYGELAESIAKEAVYTQNTFALSNMIYGQILMYKGELNSAEKYLRQALEFCPKASQFDLMIRCSLINCLQAADATEKCNQELNKIQNDIPETSFQYGQKIAIKLMFGSSLEFDEPIPEDLLQIAGMLKKDFAQNVLAIGYNTIARQFLNAEHAEKAIQRSAHIFSHYFGREVIPESIKDNIPKLYKTITQISL